MQELFEFRIYNRYADLLFKPNEGRNAGTSVRVVQITRDDPRFNDINIMDQQQRKDNNGGVFSSCEIIRKYSKNEIEEAALLHMKIKAAFEPAGEECGTVYDETVACGICKANGKQIGQLKLKKGSIPRKDISRTIADEVVVTEHFLNCFKKHQLTGISFEPVIFGKNLSGYYQLVPSSPVLELTSKTIAGVHPFDTISEYCSGSTHNIQGYEIVFEPEVHRCPLGHIIGLNLLSEPSVAYSHSIKEFDFHRTKQNVGVRRGLLRPHPIYLCSQAFRKMVIEEQLTGFEFEIAQIQNNNTAEPLDIADSK